MKDKSLRTQLVQDCESIEQLKSVIDTLEEVEGSRNIIYTAETIKERIDIIKNGLDKGVRYMDISWNALTRTHGIRGKAMELFYYKAH